MKYESLRQLKEEFIDWCALLSKEEIASNAALVGVMKRVNDSFNEAFFTPQAFFLGVQQ